MTKPVNKTGTSMQLELSPRAKKRAKAKKAAEIKDWDKLHSPVLTRKATAEELANLK